MDKVQVLLSCYNGERYIAEQLDSILGQSYPNVYILVRDDGSVDSTILVVKEYMKRYPERIQLLEGENIGVSGSFMELLRCSDPHASYYCFSDQDDIWLTHKVIAGIEQIQHERQPVMICTSTQMVDTALKAIGIWPREWKRELSFYNALFQNVAVGMTIMLNREARDLLISKAVNPQHLLMHDWWAYLVVSAFGEVLFDPEPSILYRQHDHNVVGGNKSLLHKLQKKATSFRKHFNRKLLIFQAQHFDELYSEHLSEDKKEQLKLFLQPRNTLFKRISYLRRCKLYRQSWIDQRLFQFLILIGYI